MDDDAVYTLELLTQLGHLRAENEWLTRELDEAIKSSTAVCDSYAEENQRLFDRAEAAARQVATLREALEVFQSYGCPVCGGDCASANPPVSLCPMRMAYDALAALAPEKEKKDG